MLCFQQLPFKSLFLIMRIWALLQGSPWTEAAWESNADIYVRAYLGAGTCGGHEIDT